MAEDLQTPSPPTPTAEPENQATSKPLVRIRDLTKHYEIRRGVFNRVKGHVKAVDGVDLDIYPGECLGLVGESGSGKTTVGRCLLRALSPTGGRVELNLNQTDTEVTGASPAQLRSLRRHMQMIFQDPYSSLNPRMTVEEIIVEPLRANQIGTRGERRQSAVELIEQVGLRSSHLDRYPHAFSGGQRQRIGIARALALRPQFIVADEPVSALDLSIQAQVLNLLARLQDQYHLTYLFIAHDLSVVRYLCDRVAVMHQGRIVELASVEDLFTKPKHPYTERLLDAMPVADPHRPKRRRQRAAESDHAPADGGCAYAPYCPYRESRCDEQAPDLRVIEADHQARCHFAETLSLRGIES